MTNFQLKGNPIRTAITGYLLFAADVWGFTPTITLYSKKKLNASFFDKKDKAGKIRIKRENKKLSERVAFLIFTFDFLQIINYNYSDF